MNKMGQTIAEKILSKSYGSPVKIGQFIEVQPDWAFMIDDTVGLILKYLSQAGVKKLNNPERIALFYDHYAPAESAMNATDQRNGRIFAKEAGIKHFFDVGNGISHQIAIEKGIVLPGQIAFNTDSHTTTLGAVGCFGTGLGAAEMAYVWATGKIWLRVPTTIKLVLEGNLVDGVDAKDIVLTLLGQLGSRAATYQSIEYHGSGLKNLGMSARMTLCNMGVEMGAKTTFVPPDQITKMHYEKLGIKVEIEDGSPDLDANYSRSVNLDLGSVVPMVACPHTVDNVAPANTLKKVKIDQAFLGSCTNGRLEDLQIAAKILSGKKISNHVRMIVTPASQKIYLDAINDGTVSVLIEAGCTITTPGCGACAGLHMGVLGDGETCIASSSRNFKGRMGNRNSSVYIGSPATVAASALLGCINDPRELM